MWRADPQAQQAEIFRRPAPPLTTSVGFEFGDADAGVVGGLHDGAHVRRMGGAAAVDLDPDFDASVFGDAPRMPLDVICARVRSVATPCGESFRWPYLDAAKPPMSDELARPAGEFDVQPLTCIRRVKSAHGPQPRSTPASRRPAARLRGVGLRWRRSTPCRCGDIRRAEADGA